MPRDVGGLIREIVVSYGDATARMMAAALDGIEVMPHHSHLLS
jgi:2,4-dienoyl-CoA reductase-like NADH-dependent reductase (Old Yellow Enzyme family)